MSNGGRQAPQACSLINLNIENDICGEISAPKSSEISAPKNPQGVGPWGARGSGPPGGQAHSLTGNIENTH